MISSKFRAKAGYRPYPAVCFPPPPIPAPGPPPPPPEPTFDVNACPGGPLAAEAYSLDFGTIGNGICTSGECAAIGGVHVVVFDSFTTWKKLFSTPPGTCFPSGITILFVAQCLPNQAVVWCLITGGALMAEYRGSLDFENPMACNKTFSTTTCLGWPSTITLTPAPTP